MGKMQVRQEARALQGKSLQFNSRSLHIAGGSSQAEFEMGSEGLVHLATDETSGERFRIKCFWEPDEGRRRRSERLVQLQLADLNKSSADALGGAPFGMLPALGPCTPFAVAMKNVRGENWRKLRSMAETETEYPPDWWPPAEIRATWSYGLATAVMKMETLGFIHSDLSPGNIVVNDGQHGVLDFQNRESGAASGTDEAGDIAVVDFDRYFHPPCDLPEPGQGSAGYAAPEIWQKQVPHLGSDRTAMAILIQELLVVGDPDISRTESFDWSYDQEARLFELSFNQRTTTRDSRVDVHPLLVSKYPALAKLVRDTLGASGPDTRPAPQSWRRSLLEIVEMPPIGAGVPHRGLLVEADPVRSSGLRIAFGPTKDSLDLSTTAFRIRANLERDPNGSIYLVVHNGAALNVQLPGSKKWMRCSGGARVNAEIGTVLFDQNGATNARLANPK
jgi:serine/threonine protein kinase